MEWMLTFGNLIGLLIFFIFCGLALKYINDARIKFLAFVSALIVSAILAGLVKFEHLEVLIQRMRQIIDPISVGLSGVMIGTGILLPGPIRRPLISAGLSGLVLGLLGIPVWIVWIILLLLMFLTIYVVYKIIARTLVRGVRGDK